MVAQYVMHASWILLVLAGVYGLLCLAIDFLNGDGNWWTR